MFKNSSTSRQISQEKENILFQLKRAIRAPEGGHEKLDDVKSKDDVIYILQQAGCDVKVKNSLSLNIFKLFKKNSLHWNNEGNNTKIKLNQNEVNTFGENFSG